jgi:hypothetical protein
MFEERKTEDTLKLGCRMAFCVLVLVLAHMPARATDPFDDLNETFRQQHAAAREREWSRGGPVILVGFDRLTLFNGRDRRTAEVLPPLYHRLKSVAHTPLAVYLALERASDGPVDESQQAQLKEITTRIQAVRAVLETAGFAPEALQRQRDILDRTASFIASTLESKTAGPSTLRPFASGLRPLLAKNIDEAADLQIRAYDRQVSSWQEALPGVDWGSLRVVITGSALPRKQNLATQYFARLLGVSGEGPRLVYAESLFEEAKALRLLNAMAVDGKLGQTFFDDPSILYRDLMADAAAKFLREHGEELKAKTGQGHP